MTSDKKAFVLETMRKAARLWHDGHDHYDAVKQGPGVPDIPFSACTRKHCSDLRVAIALIEEEPIETHCRDCGMDLEVGHIEGCAEETSQCE
jgi:hypothetical protein